MRKPTKRDFQAAAIVSGGATLAAPAATARAAAPVLTHVGKAVVKRATPTNVAAGTFATSAAVQSSTVREGLKKIPQTIWGAGAATGKAIEESGKGSVLKKLGMAGAAGLAAAGALVGVKKLLGRGGSKAAKAAPSALVGAASAIKSRPRPVASTAAPVASGPLPAGVSGEEKGIDPLAAKVPEKKKPIEAASPQKTPNVNVKVSNKVAPIIQLQSVSA